MGLFLCEMGLWAGLEMGGTCQRVSDFGVRGSGILFFQTPLFWVLLEIVWEEELVV